jgi:hypothetical protein
MRCRMAVLGLAGLVASAAGNGARADSPAVKYPAGYREWTHVKSMAIVSDKHPLFNTFGGIHHVYVNKTGLQATKSHGAFPNGSVLVFDLLQAAETDGAYVEGQRKLVAVMLKDSTRFKDTGGWGFEGFKGDSGTERVVTDPTGQCFHCHAAQKDHDYVFSEFRK